MVHKKNGLLLNISNTLQRVIWIEPVSYFGMLTSQNIADDEVILYLVYASYSEPNQGSAELQDFATQFLSLNVTLVHVSQYLVVKSRVCNKYFVTMLYDANTA